MHSPRWRRSEHCWRKHTPSLQSLPPNPWPSEGLREPARFYSGIENLFRRVAQEIGEGLPLGDSWHSQLLRNMALEIPQVQPKMIKKETRDRPEEFLRFQHVVRHAYGHELKRRRMRDLLDSFDPAHTNFVKDAEVFLCFLDDLAESCSC